MTKRFSILLAALMAIVLFGACGCEKPKPQEEPQPAEDTTQIEPIEPIVPADMSLIELSVPVTDNWVWSGKPQITIRITNGNAGAVQLGTRVVVTTDKKADVVTLTDSVVVGAKSRKDVVVTTTEKLEPGIYHAECYVDTTHVLAFNFAIDPFEITSVNDKPADFVFPGNEIVGYGLQLGHL